MDTEELVISIEGDTITEKHVTIEPDKPKPGTEDEAVAGFKKQLVDAEAAREAEKSRADNADRARQTAEAEAARLRDDTVKLRTESVDSQIDAVANAINAATAEGDSAERDYASAMERGDFTAAAQSQRKMSEASAKLVRLGDAKFELDNAKKAPPKPAVHEQRTDPVEAFIASRPAPVQTWLRGHMNVLTDPELGAIANGADVEARRKGIAVGSTEYFELVETRLGFRTETKSDPEPDPEKPRQQRKPMASAPMSRESAPNGSNGAPKVTLSRGEQQTATDGTITWTKNDQAVREGKAKAGEPIGVAEYAKRKHKMDQQGYYNRAAVE